MYIYDSLSAQVNTYLVVVKIQEKTQLISLSVTLSQETRAKTLTTLNIHSHALKCEFGRV